MGQHWEPAHSLQWKGELPYLHSLWGAVLSQRHRRMLGRWREAPQLSALAMTSRAWETGVLRGGIWVPPTENRTCSIYQVLLPHLRDSPPLPAASVARFTVAVPEVGQLLVWHKSWTLMLTFSSLFSVTRRPWNSFLKQTLS